MLRVTARILIGVVALNVMPLQAGITDLSEMPILMANAVTPAMVMAVDDSGSMDSELILNANDGAMWWDTRSNSFTTAGSPNFNDAGASSSTWQKYPYLFPNGNAADARVYTDSDNDHFAVPPTDAYAWLRSADYNPLYYDTSQSYIPWGTSVISGVTKTFTNATPAAARSHPIIGETNPTTFDLTTVHTDTNANWTFKFQNGMTAPAGAKRLVRSTWTAYASDTGITAKTNVAVSYYPATFYKKDATCTAAAPVCVTAPDGSKLRRYEIKAGNTFPSGRNYTDEMQNFANWFQYYRKRILMLNSSLSLVLPKLTNLRMGMIRFNSSRSTPTMVDFTTSTTAYQTLLGQLQSIDPSGGTPTRETLKYIGDQYASTTSGLVQNSCQRNNTMVITDGFANASAVSPPSSVTYGTQSLWFRSSPYTTTYGNTLADIASYYYNTNIRPDLTLGTVPINPADTNPAADKNPNPHVNTYALTLGAKGTIFGTGSNPDTNPYLYAPEWPNPNADRNPTAVDDLWHATINSRGKMVLATKSNETITAVNSIIADVLGKAGAGSAITLSNINLQSGDNTAYVASFIASTWYGELVAATVNTTNGNVSTSSPIWSLKSTLNAKDWTSRLIATYSGTTGIDFSTTDLSSTQIASLNNLSLTDNATVINYIRGDRSLEGTTYRRRDFILGDIVDAEPILVKGATSVIYQASNDGMLHAVNSTNGQELWAYIPSLVIGKLNKLTGTTYSHDFYVNGTPTVGKVGTTKLLVGGLRSGGKGYYALNVTTPTATTIADVKAKVMWEFPNASTSSTVINNVGYSYGKPVITTTAYGDVVLVTSGYNNTDGDGNGHLFVLNATTGELLADIPTKVAGVNVGTTANPSGLAQIAAYNIGTSSVPMTNYVYGGDLLGNVWKFDLTSATPAAWTVTRIASLQTATNTPQPITSTPELSTKNGKPAIYIGTGQLLGTSDKTTSQIQSFYMILDKGTVLTGSARTSLVRQIMTVGTGGLRTVTRNTVDLTASSGWYLDLPIGEKMNIDPQFAFGMITFNTNAPSSVACSSASYTYAIDQNTGGMMPDSYFSTGTAWAGKVIGFVISSRPIIAVLPSGRVISINHGSDNSVITNELIGSANKNIRKVGWRELRF